MKPSLFLEALDVDSRSAIFRHLDRTSLALLSRVCKQMHEESILAVLSKLVLFVV